MTAINKQSVQSLPIQMQFNGQPISTGTSFVANSNKGPVLITNRHNVTGRNQETGKPLSPTLAIPNEIVIYHNEKSKLGSWITKVEKLLDADDSPLWIEHPVLGDKADFVALPLTDISGIDLHPYTLGVGDPLISYRPADKISVVGFPFGLTGGGCLALWATGYVASEPDIDFSDLPVFLIDCRSRQGQSGSPVIAYANGGMVSLEDGSSSVFSGPVCRFLGIYSGRINAESDLGVVWKAIAIRELVDSIT
jgi:hypothetical protein